MTTPRRKLWFATFKIELVYRIALTTKAFARRRIIAWIDRYNRDGPLPLRKIRGDRPKRHGPFVDVQGARLAKASRWREMAALAVGQQDAGEDVVERVECAVVAPAASDGERPIEVCTSRERPHDFGGLVGG